jgi:uncharacterized protein YbdZ (MbtH family)
MADQYTVVRNDEEQYSPGRPAGRAAGWTDFAGADQVWPTLTRLDRHAAA